MEPTSEDLLADALRGDLVRELRARALSESNRADAIRNTDPITADALILSAICLKAHADKIEWLAARYLQLEQQIEYWTKIAESRETYVEQIINGTSDSFSTHAKPGEGLYFLPRIRNIGRSGA